MDTSKTAKQIESKFKEKRFRRGEAFQATVDPATGDVLDLLRKSEIPYFNSASIRKSLTAAEAIEWRYGLARYVKAYRNTLISEHRQFQVKTSGRELTDNDIKNITEAFDWLPAAITSAEVLLWDKSMFEFAFSGHERFCGQIIPDDLLCRQPELWVKNYDVYSDQSEQHQIEEASTNGRLYISPQAELLWPDRETSELHVIRIAFRQDGEIGPPLIYHSAILKPGQTLPPTISDIKSYNLDSALLAITRIEFLKSTIIKSEKESLPRHVRRQFKKETSHEPIVRVIHLRRIENKEPSGLGEATEYSCQWPVRPHWRNQYYPSTDEHKPVFIDAYIKGPKDKPLKLPKNFVFKVDR
jgi:hypothetical protein